MLIVLDAVGVSLGFIADIPAWVLIMTVLCGIWLIDALVKLKFHEIYFPLAFAFMFLEKNIAMWCGLKNKNIINNWLVFFVALLLMIGTRCLMPRKSWISRLSEFKFGGDTENSSHANKSTVYVDCRDCDDRISITNDLGECEVFFSNVDCYENSITLVVSNHLGAMTINVPFGFRIVSSIENELGAVNLPSDASSGDMTLYIEGKNELGSLKIVRV